MGFVRLWWARHFILGGKKRYGEAFTLSEGARNEERFRSERGSLICT